MAPMANRSIQSDHWLGSVFSRGEKIEFNPAKSGLMRWETVIFALHSGPAFACMIAARSAELLRRNRKDVGSARVRFQGVRHCTPFYARGAVAAVGGTYADGLLGQMLFARNSRAGEYCICHPIHVGGAGSQYRGGRLPTASATAVPAHRQASWKRAAEHPRWQKKSQAKKRSRHQGQAGRFQIY